MVRYLNLCERQLSLKGPVEGVGGGDCSWQVLQSVEVSLKGLAFYGGQGHLALDIYCYKLH